MTVTDAEQRNIYKEVGPTLPFVGRSGRLESVQQISLHLFVVAQTFENETHL